MKKNKWKISSTLLIALSIILIGFNVYAHSGRTDSNGGHRDNKNKSGLGSYHYHCGGYPAHLHTNGICPYSSSKKYTSSSKKYKTKIKINKTKYTMNKGQKYTLKISGTKKKVVWSTSNKKVATVNSKGKVTAKKSGTATITAKIGSKKYKCKISVKIPSINKTKICIAKGDTYTLKVKNTNQKIKWSSSDKKVATVNSKGKVTAKKKGTATITAKVGNKKLKCKVTINKVKKIKAEYMYIEYKDTDIEVGNTVKLSTEIYPSNYTGEIKWKSSDENVATVEKGIVKGVSSGETTITATIDGLSDSIKVKVLERPNLILKNSLPEQFAYTIGETEYTKVEIFDIKLDYTPNFYSKEYKVKITLLGTKIYQHSKHIDSIGIRYKILDENGYLYDKGTFFKSGLDVGDKFNNLSTTVYLPSRNYSLILTDY